MVRQAYNLYMIPNFLNLLNIIFMYILFKRLKILESYTDYKLGEPWSSCKIMSSKKSSFKAQ